MKRGNKMNNFRILRRLRPMLSACFVVMLALPQSIEAAESGAVQSEEAQYNLKLRDIEERVNSLKEQVFQTIFILKILNSSNSLTFSEFCKSSSSFSLFILSLSSFIFFSSAAGILK